VAEDLTAITAALDSFESRINLAAAALASAATATDVDSARALVYALVAIGQQLDALARAALTIVREAVVE
jgi:hypothetical protein